MSKSSIFSSDDDSSSDDDAMAPSVPARAVLSDSDSDSGSSHAEGSSSSSSRQKRPRSNDRDDDSDEVESSLSSSSQKIAEKSKISSNSRKKKKKRTNASVASRFFEEDAEEDDDESGFEDKDAEDDESMEQRRRREQAEMAIDRRRDRMRNNLQDMSAAEIARNIKERRRIEKRRERVFKKLSTDQQIGLLLLAQVDRFMGRTHGSSHVAVLAQALSQHHPQGGMGFNNQNASWAQSVGGAQTMQAKNDYRKGIL